MEEATRLDKLVVHREASGGGTRIDAELVVDGGQVCVDRAPADDELLGHLRIGEYLNDQL